MDNELQAKVNQFRGMKNFRGYTEAQLIDAANVSLKEKKIKEQYDFVLEGLPITTPKDKKIIRKILEDYLDGLYITNKRQLFQLKDLIYNEYKKRTTREQIETQQKSKPNSVPAHGYDAYQRLIELGQKLSEKIFGSNLKDDVSVLKQLFSRMKLWMAENQGSRSFKCAKCGEMLIAKIRMDKYDVDVHPYFKDRLLTNKFLMDKFIEGKPVIVDERFIANTLTCSVLYPEWILDRHFSKNHPLYKKYLKLKDKKKDKNNV